VQRHGEDLPGLLHDGRHQSDLAREQADLAEEAPGAVDAQHPVLGAVSLHDRHCPGEDHVELGDPLSRVEQHVTGLRCPPFAVPLQAADLLFIEPRMGPGAIRRLVRPGRLAVHLQEPPANTLGSADQHA
jgi:hypothetical protein